MICSQYDIVVVNLDPTIGSEIKKTRPCLVISPNELNTNLNTVIIAPITSTLRNYPTRIKLNLQKVNGMIAIDQIRTIDKKRIVKIIDKISNVQIRKVKDILHETFVL